MAALFRNRSGFLTRVLAGLAAAALLGSAAAGYAATAFLDAVLAEVDGTIITASDAAIARALSLFGMSPSVQPIRTADVSRLVDASLIDAEAVRLQLEVSSAELEEAWRAAADRVGGMDAMRRWLEHVGLGEAWARRLVGTDVRRRRFVGIRFRPFVFVTEEEVTKAIGPGPHPIEARENAVGALREEAVARELAVWLAEARTRAVIRTTVAEGTSLPLPFAPPASAGSPSSHR